MLRHPHESVDHPLSEREIRFDTARRKAAGIGLAFVAQNVILCDRDESGRKASQCFGS